MSLEEALAANTAALNKLVEIFDLKVVSIPTVFSNEYVTAQAAVAASNTASNTSMHPLESPSSEVAVPTAQAPVGEPVAADVIPEYSIPDYSEVALAVTQAAGKAGRETVIEMLQEKFGLASAKTAKADQYADIIAACEALMVEVA